MLPIKYLMILHYRIMILLFSYRAQCPLHTICMDVFGEHTGHRQRQPGFTYQHDMVTDV